MSDAWPTPDLSALQPGYLAGLREVFGQTAETHHTPEDYDTPLVRESVFIRSTGEDFWPVPPADSDRIGPLPRVGPLLRNGRADGV